MPLSDLLVDENEVTEEQISALIKEYIRYDKTTYRVIPTPDFNKLNAKQKVYVFLAAQHGKKFLTTEASSTGVSPTEIEEQIKIKGGTLRPTLRALLDANLISQSKDGYFIHAAALSYSSQLFKDNKSD